MYVLGYWVLAVGSMGILYYYYYSQILKFSGRTARTYTHLRHAHNTQCEDLVCTTDSWEHQPFDILVILLRYRVKGAFDGELWRYGGV